MNRGGFSLPTDVVPDVVAPQALGSAGVPGARVPRAVNDGEIARRYAGEGGSQLGGVVLAGEVVGAALQVGTVLLGVAAQLARDRHAQSEELRAGTMALVARSCSALKERFPQEASALQGRVSQALRGGAAAVAQLARALISNPNAVLGGAGSQASPTVPPAPPPGSAAARSPSVAAARTDPPRATVARTQAAVAPQAPALLPQDRTAVQALPEMLPTTGVLNALNPPGVSTPRTSAVPLDSAAALGAQHAVGNAIGNSVVAEMQKREYAAEMQRRADVWAQSDEVYGGSPFGYAQTGAAPNRDNVPVVEIAPGTPVLSQMPQHFDKSADDDPMFGARAVRVSRWTDGPDADGNAITLDPNRANPVSDPDGKWREAFLDGKRRDNALNQIAKLEDFRRWAEAMGRPLPPTEEVGFFDRRLGIVADVKDYLLERINGVAIDADPTTQVGLKLLSIGLDVVVPSTTGDLALNAAGGAAGKAVVGTVGASGAAAISVLGITSKQVDDFIEVVAKEGGDVARAANSRAGRDLIDESNKLFRQYIRQMEDTAGISMSARQREELFEAVRKIDLTAKPSQASIDAVKLQHADGAFRAQMRNEWSKRFGQDWPVYQQDALNDAGRVLAAKGDPFQMHHIYWKGDGGPNAVWNYFPSPVPQHQGLIHQGPGRTLIEQLRQRRSGG